MGNDGSSQWRDNVVGQTPGYRFTTVDTRGRSCQRQQLEIPSSTSKKDEIKPGSGRGVGKWDCTTEIGRLSARETQHFPRDVIAEAKMSGQSMNDLQCSRQEMARDRVADFSTGTPSAQQEADTMSRRNDGNEFHAPPTFEELSGLDLSHLTAEERAAILQVAARAKQIEQVENQRVISIQKQVDAISQVKHPAAKLQAENHPSTRLPPPQSSRRRSSHHTSNAASSRQTAKRSAGNHGEGKKESVLTNELPLLKPVDNVVNYNEFGDTPEDRTPEHEQRVLCTLCGAGINVEKSGGKQTRLSPKKQTDNREETNSTVECSSCSGLLCKACAVFSFPLAKKGEVLCKLCAKQRELAARTNVWLNRRNIDRNLHLQRSASLDAAVDEELNAVQKIGKTSSQKQRRYSDDVRKCCAYPTAGNKIPVKTLSTKRASISETLFHQLSREEELEHDEQLKQSKADEEMQKKHSNGVEEPGTTKTNAKEVVHPQNENDKSVLNKVDDNTPEDARIRLSGISQTSAVKTKKIPTGNNTSNSSIHAKQPGVERTRIASFEASLNVHNTSKAEASPATNVGEITANTFCDAQVNGDNVSAGSDAFLKRASASTDGPTNNLRRVLDRGVSSPVKRHEHDRLDEKEEHSVNNAANPNVQQKAEVAANTSSSKNNVVNVTQSSQSTQDDFTCNIPNGSCEINKEGPCIFDPVSNENKLPAPTDTAEKENQSSLNFEKCDVTKGAKNQPGVKRNMQSRSETNAHLPVTKTPGASSIVSEIMKSTADVRLNDPPLNNSKSVTSSHTSDLPSTDDDASRPLPGTMSITSSLADSEGPAEWSVDDLSDNDTFFLVTSSDDGRGSIPTGITKPSALRSVASGSSNNCSRSSTDSNGFVMSSYEVLDCENDTEGNFDQLAKDKNSINVENIESGSQLTSCNCSSGSTGLKRLAAFPDLSSIASANDVQEYPKKSCTNDAVKSSGMISKAEEVEEMTKLKDPSLKAKVTDTEDKPAAVVSKKPSAALSKSNQASSISEKRNGIGSSQTEAYKKQATDSTTNKDERREGGSTNNHGKHNVSAGIMHASPKETAAGVKMFINKYETPNHAAEENICVTKSNPASQKKQKIRIPETREKQQATPAASEAPVPARRSYKSFGPIPAIKVSSSSSLPNSKENNTKTLISDSVSSKTPSGPSLQKPRSPPVPETGVLGTSSSRHAYQPDESDATHPGPACVSKFGSKILQPAMRFPLSSLVATGSTSAKNNEIDQSESESKTTAIPYTEKGGSIEDCCENSSSSEDEDEKELRKFTSSVPIRPEDMQEVASFSGSSLPTSNAGIFFRRTTSTDNFEELLKRTTDTPRPSRRSGESLFSRSNRKAVVARIAAPTGAEKVDSALARSVSLSPPSSLNLLHKTSSQGDVQHRRRRSDPFTSLLDETVVHTEPTSSILESKTENSALTKKDLMVTFHPDNRKPVTAQVSSSSSSWYVQPGPLTRCVSCGVLSSTSFGEISASTSPLDHRMTAEDTSPRLLNTRKSEDGRRSISTSTQVTPEEPESNQTPPVTSLDLCQLTALIEALKNVQSLAYPPKKQTYSGVLPSGSSQPVQTRTEPVTVEPKSRFPRTKLYKEASTETSVSGEPVILPKDFVVPCRPYTEGNCRTPENRENKVNACVGTEDYFSVIATEEIKQPYESFTAKSYPLSNYYPHLRYQQYSRDPRNYDFVADPVNSRHYRRLVSLPAFETVCYDSSPRNEIYFNDHDARERLRLAHPFRYRSGDEYLTSRSLSESRDIYNGWDCITRQQAVPSPTKVNDLWQPDAGRRHLDWSDRPSRALDDGNHVTAGDFARRPGERLEKTYAYPHDLDLADEKYMSRWEAETDLQNRRHHLEQGLRSSSSVGNVSQDRSIERPLSRLSSHHQSYTPPHEDRCSLSFTNPIDSERHPAGLDSVFGKQHPMNHPSHARQYTAVEDVNSSSFIGTGNKIRKDVSDESRGMPRSTSKRVLPAPPGDENNHVWPNGDKGDVLKTVSSHGGTSERVFPQTSRTSSNWRQTIEDLDQEEKELDLRLRYLELGRQNHTTSSTSSRKPYKNIWSSLDSNDSDGFLSSLEPMQPIDPEKSLRRLREIVTPSPTTRIGEHQDTGSSNLKNYVVVDDVSQITSSAPTQKFSTQVEKRKGFATDDYQFNGARRRHKLETFLDEQQISKNNLRRSASRTSEPRVSPRRKPESSLGYTTREARETVPYSWCSLRSKSRSPSDYNHSASNTEYKMSYALQDPDELFQNFSRSREGYPVKLASYGPPDYDCNEALSCTDSSVVSRGVESQLRNTTTPSIANTDIKSNQQHKQKECHNEYIRTSPSAVARETYRMLTELERNGLLGNAKAVHGYSTGERGNEDGFRYRDQMPCRRRHQADDVRTVVSETEAYHLEHELNDWFEQPLDGSSEDTSTYAEFSRDRDEQKTEAAKHL